MDSDMVNAAQKTPISLLQELCAQNEITPEYRLTCVEGAVHAPTFTYKVQVAQVVATAAGHSKKKAKHAAAKAMLERLLASDGEYPEGFVSDGVTVNAETLNEVISETCTAPTEDENVSENPVGILQEQCLKMGLPPPYYETEKAIGPPHEKVFSIMCVINHITTTGEGKSKRLAKRQAADNMLKNLMASKHISKDDETSKEKNQSNGEDFVEKEDCEKMDERDSSLFKNGCETNINAIIIPEALDHSIQKSSKNDESSSVKISLESTVTAESQKLIDTTQEPVFTSEEAMKRLQNLDMHDDDDIDN